MRRAGGLLLASFLLLGCSKDKAEQCARLRSELSQRETQAPKQGDTSAEAQADSWRWRADRASERARTVEARPVIKPLDASRGSIVDYFRAIATKDRVIANAIERHDSRTMNKAIAEETRFADEERKKVEATLDAACR